MFRKIAHIILAIILITTTTGFSISKHYCGTRLVSVAINTEPESCCGDEESSGCCHNEIEQYQLTNYYVSSFIVEDVSISSVDILFPIVYVILQTQITEGVHSIFPNYESPPPLKIQAVLSLYQLYLC